jgi:predicted molibdopterin-dependent oxidoreductase YjgC
MDCEVKTGRLELGEARDVAIRIIIDGHSYGARMGETVLTAVRLEHGHIRSFEFHAEKRAGFCCMGACQDCWLWLESGERIRACSTLVQDGMRLVTTPQETFS